MTVAAVIAAEVRNLKAVAMLMQRRDPLLIVERLPPFGSTRKRSQRLRQRRDAGISFLDPLGEETNIFLLDRQVAG